MLGLQIGVSLAVAAGLIVALHALGARVAIAVIGGVTSLAIALLFTITVAAGPRVVRLGKTRACLILDARLTQPASCGPRGLPSLPVRIAGSAIQLSDGGHVPIVPGRVKSNIEVSTGAGNGFAPIADIEGWAASISDRRPASGILVFSSAGRFVGAISPTSLRPDVATVYRDPALKQSGFILTLPLKLIQNRFGTPRPRLFALAGGVASPMVFHCNGRNKQLGC